jgi:hypothetical protein
LLLLLRLTLVPLLVAAVTLVVRRWGTRAAAFVAALPAVAGPTLGFYAVQQGHPFAAHAAAGALLGLVGVAAFCCAYGYAALRFSWPLCLAVGWMAFGLVTLTTLRVEVPAVVGLTIAITALLLVRWLLPRRASSPNAPPPPAWDLPVRMLSALALVFALTSAAAHLGPTLSGLLTPFPVVTAIVGGFMHAQQGTGAVLRFLRGYMPGLCSFAVFCFVFALTLPAADLATAAVVALTAQLAAQGVLLRLLKQLGE